jgi:hypothetical protein
LSLVPRLWSQDVPRNQGGAGAGTGEVDVGGLGEVRGHLQDALTHVEHDRPLGIRLVLRVLKALPERLRVLGGFLERLRRGVRQVLLHRVSVKNLKTLAIRCSLALLARFPLPGRGSVGEEIVENPLVASALFAVSRRTAEFRQLFKQSGRGTRMNRYRLNVPSLGLFGFLLGNQDVAKRLEGPCPFRAQSRQMRCRLFKRFRRLAPFFQSLVGPADSQPDFALLRSFGVLGQRLEVLFQLFLN